MHDHLNHTRQDDGPSEASRSIHTDKPSSFRLSPNASQSAALVLTGLFLMVPVAYAHAPSSHGQMHGSTSQAARQMQPQEQYAWGKMGQASEVVRDIEISMTDNMRFTPDKLTVKLGETVRFVVRNDGTILHEFVLGTPEELQKHAELMEKFPNMVHDEPYMAHVDPGQKGEVVWQFNRPGEFDFACLLPGHFQAGMVGKILVQ